MKIKNVLMAGALLLVAHTASAGPFSYGCTDCPITIGPDPSTATSTIAVADTGAISDITVVIDAFHTWQGDLIISLEHNGTTTVLADLTGTGSVDYTGGTYDATAAFAGADLAGDWNLIIEDTLFGDQGTLDDWSISGNADMTAMPEPSVLLLMGAGLAGIGFARRRVR